MLFRKGGGAIKLYKIKSRKVMRQNSPSRLYLQNLEMILTVCKQFYIKNILPL